MFAFDCEHEIEDSSCSGALQTVVDTGNMIVMVIVMFYVVVRMSLRNHSLP